MFEWVSLEIGLEEGKKTLLFEILEGNTNKPFLTDRKVIVVLHFQHFIHNKIQKKIFKINFLIKTTKLSVYAYQPFNRGKIIREKNTQKISFFKEVFFVISNKSNC